MSLVGTVRGELSERGEVRVETPPKTAVVLRYVLERNAAEEPGEVFVTFEDGVTWTRQQAVDEMYAAANALRDAGVGQGDNVLILVPNGEDFLRAWWGACCLGAVAVSLNTAFRGESLRHALRTVQSEVIVVDDRLVDRLDLVGATCRRLAPAELRSGDATPPTLAREIEVWDPHSIIFTSGTTGPAKASLTTYLHVYVNAGWAVRDVGLGSGDTYLIDLPLFHQAAQARVVSSLGSRVKLALRGRPELTRYWEVAKESGVTSAMLISSMTQYLLDQPEGPQDRDHSIHTLVVAPPPLDPDGFMARFGIKRLITAYGSTETGSVLVQPLDEPLVRGSLGRPREGVEVRLVDPFDMEVPVGEPGELIVRTARPWELSAGYVNDPEATARAWRNGWFHTGDLLRMEPSGHYFFHDRLKDAVRRRGENVSSFEVERDVAQYPGVHQVACVAMADDDGAEEEIKVFIVPVVDATIDFPGLLEWLVERMPHFMVPRYYELIDELPTSPSLKVKKHELRSLGNSEATWDREKHGYTVTRYGLLGRPAAPRV
jgi:crotonobetaine/carnitine-CoA ligase